MKSKGVINMKITSKQQQQNNYKLLFNTVKMLSKSQGSYGRLLEQLNSMSKDERLELANKLPNFKDCLDVVLWIEQ